MKMLLRAACTAAAMSIAACGGAGIEQGTPQPDTDETPTTPVASPTAVPERPQHQPTHQPTAPSIASPTASSPSPPPPTALPTAAPEPAPSHVATPAPPRAGGSAGVLAVLDSLAVEAEYESSGYERSHFDHDRHYLCGSSGSDPYTGEPFTPDTCDVDHIVAAKEAYESGAWSWAVPRRERFGNASANLVASRDCVNRSKGAGDLAEWSGTVGSGTCEGVGTTPQGRCFLAHNTVEVKAEWSLSVDPSELAALRNVLQGCDNDSPASPTSPVSEPADEPTAGPSQTSSAGKDGDCHPAYSPCLLDLPGDALNCGDLTADQKPVTVRNPGIDPYRLDRDGDGRGCTS